jgi:hypothetical protein
MLDLSAKYLASVAPSGNVLSTALVAGLLGHLAAMAKMKDSITFSIILQVLFAKWEDCTFIFIFPRVFNVILYTSLDNGRL